LERRGCALRKKRMKSRVKGEKYMGKEKGAARKRKGKADTRPLCNQSIIAFQSPVFLRRNVSRKETDWRGRKYGLAYLWPCGNNSISLKRLNQGGD